MLTIYLNSNEALQLNDSFKLYLTIFSVNHEKFKAVQGQKNKKRTPQFYKNKKVHVGCNDSKNIFRRNWALDFPYGFPKAMNIFFNKCLLLCIIVGLLQHAYYEKRLENRAYIYAIQINSKNEKKQRYAGNILLNQLTKLMEGNDLAEEGLYELLPTLEVLAKKYQTQFFVFSGLADKKKLELMHPETYDDSLKPIFLYHRHDSRHMIFIKSINTYFRANYRICFVCKKSFSTAKYRHLCPQRECCFACRRFYSKPTTYLNSFLVHEFCDRFSTTEQSFNCAICNLTIFSKHCLKGHRKLCNGQGYLGWKCSTCNKFFYRYTEQNSHEIKRNHTCVDVKKCHYCLKPNSIDHLCEMKKCIFPKTWPILGFLTIEFLQENSQLNPFLAIIYVEKAQEPGCFNRYVMYDLPDANESTKIDFFSYFPLNFCIGRDVLRRKVPKQDFEDNLKRLYQKSPSTSLKIHLLQTLMKSPNVTYICQDENSTILVIIFMYQCNAKAS